MSAGRIVLLVFGIIFLVGAVFLMLAGGGLLWVNAAATDADGFLKSRTATLETDAYAIVTEPAEVRWDCRSGWCYDPGDFVTFKIEGTNENPSKGTFIGIARERDVNRYLEDVEYDEIIEWTPTAGSNDIEYRRHYGDSVPAEPTSQTFWDESVYGADTQSLVWEPKEGNWIIVVMNQDASAGIEVTGSAGAKVPWLFWTGLGFVVGGAVILVLGIVMVYFAAREPKRSTPGQAI